MQTSEQKFAMMTQSPIKKLVVRLAIPTMISMIVTSVYNMADTFFVGQISTSATAAVGIGLPLMTIIQALGFMFGHGSGNNISRLLGIRNTKDASKIASIGFFFSIIAGVLICVLGLVFLEPMTRLFGATETSLDYALDYIRIILYGAPVMMGAIVLNNQMRFQGSATYAMIGIASGAVLNIALDPIFIFVLDMGTKGAAIATVISQTISFIILLIAFYRSNTVKISFKAFRPNLKSVGNIIFGGLPSLWRQGLGSVAVICLNLTAKPFGDAAIAAMTIVSKITMFATSLMIGFAQGFQPVCGFNYGAGKYDRVKKAFYFCLIVATAMMTILATIGIAFSKQLVEVFRDDPKVIEIGSLALILQCASFPFLSWYILSNMMLQTIGKSFRASVLAASRQGIFFIPIIFILAKYVGLLGVQISQPIADILSLLLSIPLCLSVLKQMSKKQTLPDNITKDAVEISQENIEKKPQ